MKIELLVTIAILVTLLIVNGGGPLWRWWRARRASVVGGAGRDTDLRATADALAYIHSITAIPATFEQRLKALEAGDSPAQFMRALLEKGAKP